jgi:hypothetical protein
MPRSKNVGIALIGLLAVSAISLAVASGRKPAESVKASMRHVSTSEAMDILCMFPELVPDYLAKRKDDAEYMAGTFGFVEVTIAPLARVFPTARFYRGHDFYSPPHPYLMAIDRGKGYAMPHGFNRLIIDNGLKVTDKNIIELAKAFVTVAIGERLPKVTFLQATRTKQVISGRPYSVRLEIQTDEQTEEWFFSLSFRHDQFGTVYRRGPHGYITQYDPATVQPSPGQGQLNLGTPSMAIETTPVGNAYVEHEVLPQFDTLSHYYLIVELNQNPNARDTVVFSLDSFPPESTNVYVRVRDEIRGVDKCVRKVNMSSGSGRDTWTTAPACSTGICQVSAGYAQDSNPSNTYYPVTGDRELTLEGAIVTLLPSAHDTLLAFYCDQSFNIPPQVQETHADTFAWYVINAMHQSWQTQVDSWQLGTPPCSLGVYFVYANDNQHWYHGPKGSWAGPGAFRQMGLRSNLWYGDNIDRAYSTESIRVKVAVAHEFYHGIQWGLDPAKWTDSTWRWFHEGQARFLPSVQYETEEFLDGNHLFPDDANKYLTQHLNTSLESLSVDTILRGYPYGLFWRFMYEKFLKNSISIVRDCYAESVGTGSSISEGKKAIDRAIAKYCGPGQPSKPRFSDFLHSIDSFAVACYLNDTSFGLWHDPNDVYSPPSLTVDTVFRLGAGETDSIVIEDSIPCSYGFDLMQLRLNDDVDTLLVKLSSVSPAVALQASAVRVFSATPRDTIRVDSLLMSSVHSAGWRLPTQDAGRVCLVITRHDTLDDSANGADSVWFKVKRAVAVSDSPPISDTVIAGSEFTPRAVVANRGWMKEVFDAAFKIGTAYTSTVSCTLDAGGSKVIDFTPWETDSGIFATCCSVYIASDTTRGDDTLRGSLAALSDTWQARLDVPASVSHGGSLAAVGDTLIYAFRGGYSKAFYCYDVRSKNWTAKESLSYAVGHGASLT